MSVGARRALVVDARVPFGSGLGRYFRESVKVLAAEGGFSELVLAGDERELREFVATLAGQVRVVPLAGKRYAPHVPLVWRGLVEREAPGAISWFPAWDGAWDTPRTVTTVHDLIHFGTPGLGGLARRLVARPWISRMVAGSAQLVTGTAAAADRIVAAFPRAQGKLTVIPHGVAPALFDAVAQRAALPKPSALAALSAPFLLTVANKKEHKNLEMALGTLADLREKIPELQLVMVGDRFAHARRLDSIIGLLGLRGLVHDISGITDQELAWCYANAEAFLMTSRDEGFGMVVLEAMACGAPVISVDRAPLPEVMGGAGVLVPFDDDRAMADAVVRLRQDPTARAAQVARGTARAAEFTWRASALRLADVLHRA